MLTLNDGRNELWQWDTKRKLTVDADCSQVHFSNKVFGRSIDVDVLDGVASIPDILLQTDKELAAWAFVGTAENGYTKISKVFKVNRRNKPADYVFTPPEQTTLAEIMERIDDLEAIQDPDAIKNAVDDYLANNPIKVQETDPTVPNWAKEKEKPKYTADEVGALSKEELSGAVNEALAQAKESGEFDGKDGADGKDGKTPVKGIDYFDGQPGKDGEPGKDYVLTSADKEEIAELASELVEVPEPSSGIEVTGATVGQTVKISAVDENGVPTAWEPVDFPSGGGGGYELVGYVQLEENVVSVDIELGKPCTNLIIAAYTNTRSAGGNSPHFVTVEADGKENSISAKYNIYANDYAVKVWCPATVNTTSNAVRSIVLGYYHYEKADGVFAGFSGEVEAGPGYSRIAGFSGACGITGDFINKLNFSCTDANAYLAKGVQISIWGC